MNKTQYFALKKMFRNFNILSINDMYDTYDAYLVIFDCSL